MGSVDGVGRCCMDNVVVVVVVEVYFNIGACGGDDKCSE